MPAPHFGDPDRRPTPRSITTALGRAAPAWRELFQRLHQEASGLEETWSYYRDGGSWLLRITRKARTVCWVSVERGRFRVAFYFPARLDAALLGSDLSAARKRALRSGKPIGKLRPVPVVFGPRSGAEDVLRLVRLKEELR